MLNELVVRTAALGALCVLGCRREAEHDGLPTGAQGSVASTARAEDRPLIPASAEGTTIAVHTKARKARIGDWLESDIYFFRALKALPCGKELAPTQPARAASSNEPTLLGVEVEIKAKLSMTISPKEVSLHDGGVVYDADLDLEKRFEDCTPRLKIEWLKPGRIAKGFVLFRVPPPEPAKLELNYQPTRWGGAGRVGLELPLRLH